LPADAADRLIATGREVFAGHIGRPGVWAFWWPRFLRIAHWFVAAEGERRARVAVTVTEAKGELAVDAPAGPFVLTAVADRIDRLTDGTLAIVDYKTGAPPSQKEVAAGFAPQLPLEAAMATAGGFADVAAAPVTELDFWRLKGGDPAGEVRGAGDDPGTLAEEALEGLVRLVAAFDFPDTAYRARPHPEHAPRYSDYQHLARVKEWSTAGGDGE
jgi:ATP-dependent helicase/nuclease subunit B